MKRCPICVRPFPKEERFCSVHGLPLVEERLEIGEKAGDLSGQVLDHRYRLAGVAGQGGMGVVYEAENLRIGRRCAVKVLHPHLHADDKMRMRLFREVQATSRIRHPNVVEILDYGQDERGSYLVMEYIDGKSLGQLIREQSPLPLATVYRIAVQLTSALSATHANGLIHRDLKPSNVRLLKNGLVKVLDFGLVKPYEDQTRQEFVTISTGGIAFGTPWYMSPEQASFKPLDPRSDIYALGVVLYEMFTGQLPFSAESPLEVIQAQLKDPVPLPRSLDPPVDVPAGTEMMLLKCMAKHPDQRYQSMAQLTDEIYELAEDQGIGIEAIPAENPADHIASRELEIADIVGEYELPATVGSAPAIPHESGSDWTIPVRAPRDGLREVRKLGEQRVEGLIERIVSALRSTFARYRALDEDKLRHTVELLLTAAFDYLSETPPTELPEALHHYSITRTDQRFTLTELVGAVWMGYSVARPLIHDASGNDMRRYVDLEEAVDQRILPFLFRLTDHYVALSQSKLVRLNETLSRRNEELEHLRNMLAARVRTASSALAETEQLKAHVADSITSGLLLVERGTHQVKLFNRAMERLIGVTADQVIDRPMEEVVHFVSGVPYDEFLEQIRTRGEVGLRKLWLRLPNGAERAIYISGQAFFNAKMEHTGTLFVVDDVTEREQIIESFSRYVSRDVVARVLRRGAALSPGAEARHAVLMAVNLCDFGELMRTLDADSLVDLLTDYVRSVSETVFHRGGIVDTVVGDGVLIYFDNPPENTQPALAAAIELVQRIESINQRREARSKPLLKVGVGMHSGQVLMVNAGSKSRMIYTVIGQAAQTALALRDVAAPNEILITEAVGAGGSADLQLGSGPMVQVRGQPDALAAFRVVFRSEPIETPETVN